MSEEMELEACYDYMELHPEVRPAIAMVREAVRDDDGFVTHYEARELLVAVHTLQTGRNGWVCELEGGKVMVIPHEEVRFVDGEED